jgi:hypothetical protein
METGDIVSQYTSMNAELAIVENLWQFLLYALLNKAEKLDKEAISRRPMDYINYSRQMKTARC